MISYKKFLIFLAFLTVSATLAGTAYAATPTLSMSAIGSDSIQVNVTGDPNASMILHYTKQNVGITTALLGTTDANGSLLTTISTSSYGALAGSSAYVTVGLNGASSQTVTWPGLTGASLFSLSQTGLVMSVGQTASLTASNSQGTIYLSNNSNPPIANINISGSQISISAISNGTTVVTICSGTSSTCASAYVTVGNTAAQPVVFSMNSITVAPGQSVPISVSGGNGTYTILTNSNSSLIQSAVSGSIVTLTANSISGFAAITVCSSDMSSCGIINATAGTASSAPISFSQISPALSVGQNLIISITGGLPGSGSSVSYYLSNNTNSSIVSASIYGSSSLSLTGIANGSATITVCSAAASCGSFTATVSYSSTGGTFQLSQNSISLLLGQILTVTVLGGSSPYYLSGTGGSVAQASLGGNIVSVSGISAGSSSINVCSSSGACLPLSIIVNASGTGAQLGISPNSVSIVTGGSSSVTLSGSGGYYLSVSTSPSVASVQISGNTAVVTGLNAGTTNVSICQSGGQCAILFVTVNGSTTSGSNPIFSQTSPSLSVGQVINIAVSGGSGSNYYVLNNTNPGAVQTSLSNNQLALTGITNGTSTVMICATAGSCSSLTATVGAAASTALSFLSANLPAPTVGQAYTSQLSATGGSGSYTFIVASGTLPSGLTLSSGGLISGMPTAQGAVNFTVTAKDTAGSSASTNFSLSVAGGSSLLVPVTAPVAAPVITSNPGSYTNGQLINESGTVYIVYLNTKVGFANAPAFLGLGFSFDNVTNVSDSGLAVSPKVVVTSDGGHPRGSWLLSGQTVYFLTPNGLIPIADWDTFLNNGGQEAFIVKANSYDLSFPQLPVMTSGDARLK